MTPSTRTAFVLARLLQGETTKYQLAEELGVTPRAVLRSIHAIEDAGVVRVEVEDRIGGAANGICFNEPRLFRASLG